MKTSPPCLLAAFVGALSISAAERTTLVEPPRTGYFFYVGTYTGEKSKGIYLFRLDSVSGDIVPMGLAAETASPSFLALHPDGRTLYAVGELGEFAGRKSGAVSAFAVHLETRRLSLLNQQPSGGGGPCHLTVDATGRWLLVANYGGGSASVFPIERDGRLGASSSLVQHTGSSVNPRRQEAPHAHGIYLDAANRHAFVPDLGLDKLMVYCFDAKAGALREHSTPWARLAPGSGPRHMTFDPKGRFVYVLNELMSTITTFAYDRARGELEDKGTMSTLPKDFVGDNTTAEIVVHPTGKFLYASNRGHNSIAVFAVDRKTGQLQPRSHASTRGKTPRHFALDPTGSYLLAANQDSDSIGCYRVDPRTGALEPVGGMIEAPRPVCILFLPWPKTSAP
jgi:6-phosphogluconolactonase